MKATYQLNQEKLEYNFQVKPVVFLQTKTKLVCEKFFTDKVMKKLKCDHMLYSPGTSHKF